MSIQELIQKNKSAFEKQTPEDGQEPVLILLKKVFWQFHTQSLKDLIDAVIESREKAKKEQKYEDNDYFEYSIIETYNEALDDTIKELQAIKELL